MASYIVQKYFAFLQWKWLESVLRCESWFFLESYRDISGFTCIEMSICWQGSVFILFSSDTAMYDNELIKSKENTI